MELPQLNSGVVTALFPDMSTHTLNDGEVAEYQITAILTGDTTEIKNASSTIKFFGNVAATAVTPTSIQKGNASGEVSVMLSDSKEGLTDMITHICLYEAL